MNSIYDWVCPMIENLWLYFYQQIWNYHLKSRTWPSSNVNWLNGTYYYLAKNNASKILTSQYSPLIPNTLITWHTHVHCSLVYGFTILASMFVVDSSLYSMRITHLNSLSRIEYPTTDFWGFWYLFLATIFVRIC